MKVEYGFFSFTEITDPAAHRSYNEWHQLDHLPEQFPLAGVAYGQRWVSSPQCRAARAVSGPDLDPIHYVTCYLMAEPIAQTIDEFFALGAELRRLDRFHRERRAHLTGPFAVVHSAAAPRVLVSAAAVPFRAHKGLFVMVETLQDPDPRDDQRWLQVEHEPALLAVPGVAGLWTFVTPREMSSPRWTSGARRITVCWLDDDALAVAARLAPLVAARRDALAFAEMVFAGPFETITPWEWNWFE